MNLKKTLKILIPIHTLPTVPQVHAKIIEALVPKLEEKYNVELYWFVYLPEKINQKPQSYRIIDIHDFSNAVEPIKQIKPDLVYAHSTPSLDLQFAITLAAKHHNIPVLSGVWADRWIKSKKTKKIFSYITRFLESQVPTETNKEKKKLLWRGRFFVFKTFFLYKTLRSMKFSKFMAISKIYEFLKIYFSTEQKFDPQYAAELHWLENESMVKKMTDSGYEKSSLLVTGNPLYDSPVKRIQNFKPRKKDEKIRILFATSAVVEHGIWTKNQLETTIKNIVKNISKHDELVLTVKVSPLEDHTKYSTIINNIDKNVRVVQDGDFLDYLEESDVVISYTGITSVAIFTLLAKKPLIITNFFNSKGDKVLEKNVAINCNKASQLTDLIKKSMKENPISEHKIDEFLKESFYNTDGKAAERLCSGIIDLLERRDRK